MSGKKRKAKQQRKNVQLTPAPQPQETKLVMSLQQIEERLLKSVLSGTLALHILRNSRTPTSELLEELMNVEAEVGQFVGQAMQMHVESLKATNLKGVLAGALSFIPLRPQVSAAVPIPSAPKLGHKTVVKQKITPTPKKNKKSRRKK